MEIPKKRGGAVGSVCGSCPQGRRIKAYPRYNYKIIKL